MPLLKEGRLIEDTWVVLADGANAPAKANIVVSFDRLKQDLKSLISREGLLGVYLDNNVDVHELAPFIEKLSIISLNFPVFTDGRAYSQARTLTTELEFTGELRATGDVLVDQGIFMSQCGFTTFETDERQSPNQWLSIANAMSLAYQKGYNSREGFSPREVLEERDQNQPAAWGHF